MDCVLADAQRHSGPPLNSIVRLLTSIAQAVAIAFLGFSATMPAYAASGGCAVTDEQFLHGLSTMKDWSSIYAIFKQNIPSCPDDGFYAEGYTEVVVVALAKKWSDFPQLERLMKKDPSFRRFVYRHITGSAGVTDLREFLRNAETKCPAQAKSECSEIAKHARMALKEAE